MGLWMDNMMRDQINTALKEAMKSQDRRRTSTLRLINAAIKDRDIAARGGGKDKVSDEDVLHILTKMVKQREESKQIYEQAGRLDLADQESEEMAIIEEFLPKKMCDDEMRAACAEVVGDIGAQSLKDMGRTMNALKERYPGQMDMSRASTWVRDLLN